MRVLFVVRPEKTTFLPMVPLAWALRTAGHDVRVAAQPAFADVVTQAGLTAVGVGRDADLWRLLDRAPGRSWTPPQGPTPPYDAAVRSQPPDLDEMTTGYAQAVETWHRRTTVPTVAALTEFARRWRPDLVIWEPLAFAGPIAAKACGAAHARLPWSVDVFGVTRDRFRELNGRQPSGRQADPLAEWLAGYARKYGFDATEDLVSGQFTVDLLPPSLNLRADLHYVPLRFVPYGGPAVVPRWLYTPAERPRIALTLGLNLTDHRAGYRISVRDVLGSLADLDVEVVATIAGSEQHRLGPAPGNARIVPYVPLHALAPTCAAVVHHGGFGTTLTTAVAGVPHLTLPWEFDEPALGGLLAEQGAGLTIPAERATGPAVRAAVLRLLDEPAFTARAADLRAEMHAMPTPNDLVGRLEELTASHRVATR